MAFLFVFVNFALPTHHPSTVQMTQKKLKKSQETLRFPGISGGDCWTRTSDLLRVKRTAIPRKPHGHWISQGFRVRQIRLSYTCFTVSVVFLSYRIRAYTVPSALPEQRLITYSSTQSITIPAFSIWLSASFLETT